VNITETSSEEVEEGIVISQDPEGNVQAEEGSYVTIEVSVGPDLTGKTEMPKILGMTEQEARNTLNAFGLRAGNVRTIIDSNPENRGLVIAQDVEPGEMIDEGTAVNFDIAGQQTYSYSADIFAPTKSEDPDYKPGTAVHITIVTDGFHQFRASLIAKDCGLSCDAVSAKTPWYLAPSYWVREWLGVAQFLIFG
jgi:serine/threonine-protein kinase